MQKPRSRGYHKKRRVWRRSAATERHRGRRAFVQREDRRPRQKHHPERVEGCGEARDDPEPQQRRRTAPCTQNGKNLDVGCTHHTQCEQGNKTKQPHSRTDQRLGERYSEWIAIEGRSHQGTDQPRDDKRVSNSPKADIARRDERRPAQEYPDEEKTSHHVAIYRDQDSGRVTSIIRPLQSRQTIFGTGNFFLSGRRRRRRPACGTRRRHTRSDFREGAAEIGSYR